jgi:UDP-2,4-diacetamido-2,4,6-trideoxy-beta-L-altropyranose hydrolase
VSGSIAFRVDASTKIGIGHVMRCLTLADALAAAGARVRFASRHLPPHLRDLVRRRGHECVVFETPSSGPLDELSHGDWLETSQAADASDTAAALADRRWHAIVVDHYALDWRWETALGAVAPRLMVIDDLADRRHDCDVLLDQNVYPDMETRYEGLVPPGCETLIGPEFALLRPEFRAWRERVSPRSGTVERVMVSLGGVDGGDLTRAAIRALQSLRISGPVVDVVVGASHPRLAETLAATRSAGFTAHVQSSRMAELMASADLAIGAAGSTSWERCCVGLPTVCVATAHNQRAIAEGLESRGVSVTAGAEHGLDADALAETLAPLLANHERVAAMSRAAWDLVDGLGTARVRDGLVKAPCN